MARLEALTTLSVSKVRPPPSRGTSSEIDEPPVETKEIIKVAPKEEQPRRLGRISRQEPLDDFLTHVRRPLSAASEGFEIGQKEDPT